MTFDIEMIPDKVMEECLQLVKANSIEGCKLPSCSVCYTRFTNLRKDGSMDVGQIGFHNPKQVRCFLCMCQYYSYLLGFP